MSLVLGYRTKYFQDIIPSKCEISVTHDNRLSISNVDRSKKKNTPERTKDSINYNGNNGQTSKSLSDMLEEMNITQENDDLDSDDMQYLVRIFPDVIDKLKSMDNYKRTNNGAVWSRMVNSH